MVERTPYVAPYRPLVEVARRVHSPVDDAHRKVEAVFRQLALQRIVRRPVRVQVCRVDTKLNHFRRRKIAVAAPRKNFVGVAVEALRNRQSAAPRQDCPSRLVSQRKAPRIFARTMANGVKRNVQLRNALPDCHFADRQRLAVHVAGDTADERLRRAYTEPQRGVPGVARVDRQGYGRRKQLFAACAKRSLCRCHGRHLVRSQRVAEYRDFVHFQICRHARVAAGTDLEVELAVGKGVCPLCALLERDFRTVAVDAEALRVPDKRDVVPGVATHVGRHLEPSACT